MMFRIDRSLLYILNFQPTVTLLPSTACDYSGICSFKVPRSPGYPVISTVYWPNIA